MPETSPPAFLNDERFIDDHRKVFVMFRGRYGYSEETSTEELPRLQRTGSRFALDRRKKIEIAEVYHKAGKHAYYGYYIGLGTKPE
jgi:hypothetical protein